MTEHPSADRPLLLPEIPKSVTEAAARIRVDIRAAIEAIYGDLGGEDDTTEDVEATERAIARDMATVLDWIATPPPSGAEHREEWRVQRMDIESHRREPWPMPSRREAEIKADECVWGEHARVERREIVTATSEWVEVGPDA